MGIVKNNEKIDGLAINGEKVAGVAFNGDIIYTSGFLLGRKILKNCTLITEKPDFSKIATDINTNIYQDEDDDGTTYYFRGDTLNNWVKFGKENDEDIWWRIIRINGDETIRMIYAGISNEGPHAITKTGIQSTPTNFNYRTTDSTGVGFRYENGVQRGVINESIAYGKIMDWFKNNLNNEFEMNQIDKDAGFCGDRSSSTNTSILWSEEMTETWYPTSNVYYGEYLRGLPEGNIPSSNNPANPTFKCGTAAGKILDNYTYVKAKNGNNKLEYPVGLITADEAMYAGGLHGFNNSSYYLCTTGRGLWTMSPARYTANNTINIVTVINSNGSLDIGYPASTTLNFDLRPVINLKKDVIATGDGTIDNPYIIN